MIQIIFIIIVTLSFLFYVLNFKKIKNEEFENIRYKWENPIKIQLQEKRFEFIDIVKPNLKEVFKSYPFSYSQITIFTSGQSSYTPVDFKIIFKNQNGILCENWLQITENPFNGNITFDWQPNLEIFIHSRVELRY